MTHEHGDRYEVGQHEAGQHGHGQLGHGEVDWDALGALLERDGDVYMTHFEGAARWLRELVTQGGAADDRVGRILDIGSGHGVAAAVLAETFPAAEAVAVDGSPALLERARRRADARGVGDRVRMLHVELPDGLDHLGEADLIWASDVVHHFGDQLGLLRRLRGLLRPGGVLATGEGGLRPRYLPSDIGIGRRGLQARLDAAWEDTFADMRAGLPDAVTVVEDWPGLLARAGFEPLGSRTFLIDLPSPLALEVREHVRAGLARAGDYLGERLDADDRATLARLVDPEDAVGLLRRPDVFLRAARTVYAGRAPS